MADYRFHLDDKIDADLIAFIDKKANGGPRNAAMKLFAQNQYAIHIDRNSSPSGHISVSTVSNEDEMEGNAINLSGLDAAF